MHWARPGGFICYFPLPLSLPTSGCSPAVALCGLVSFPFSAFCGKARSFIEPGESQNGSDLPRWEEIMSSFFFSFYSSHTLFDSLCSHVR